MSQPVAVDPHESLSHLLASHVRKLREAHGQTQKDVGDAIRIKPVVVGHWERCRQPIPATRAKALDRLWGTGGLLELLVYHAQRQHGDWLARYIELERTARQISEWQPLVVPGLLQTERYARVLTAASTQPGADMERVVKSRLSRQEILTKSSPPLLWLRLDERILTQNVGGWEVMREQLDRLARVAEEPNVSLQLVSDHAGAHAGLDGSFILLRTPEGEEIGYVEAALGGRLVQDLSDVVKLSTDFSRISTKCLSEEESLRKIIKAMEELS